MQIQLTLTIEEVDAETCRQSLDGHIIVRIFGVGRVVEAIVKESLVNTYKFVPSGLTLPGAASHDLLKQGCPVMPARSLMPP